MKRMRNTTGMRGLLALAALSLLAASCVKERMSVSHEPGTQIVFGASTEWNNDPLTKTEYSGKDETDAAVNSGSKWERIDWVAGSDRIRILCDAASGGHELSGKGDDYTLKDVSVNTSTKRKSTAKIDPSNGNGLQWGADSDDHYFYAFYPAPGMQSNYDFGTDRTVSASNAKIESVTGNKAKVTGVVPATQKVVKVGNEYKANMNYAYMYAGTLAEAGSSGDVPLDFHPLVTTVEFTLKRIPSDPVNLNLTRLELSSTDETLTGEFTAQLSFNSDGEALAAVNSTPSSPGSKITIDLPTESGQSVPGVKLSDTPLKVTFLMLPYAQTNLTLTLYFGADYSMTRILKLKDNGTFITVPACKKTYIRDLGVQGSIYYFDVTGPTSSLAAAGESTTYKVKSYVSADGTNTGVGWTAKFSEDDGATWSTTKPTWLTAFTASDAAGSTTDKSYTATASANKDYLSDKVWLGETTVGSNSTSGLATDLSMQDIYGNAISQSTANCYVVSAPGWYKIPCVYGNALKDGADNPTAYSNTNTDTYALTAFVRHDGNAITSPWIKDNGITVTEAKLLWMDARDLVTQVSYSGDYVYFYVNPDTIFQGNAIVAAYAGSTIVWSWHIWVMEGTDYRDNLTTTAFYGHPEPTPHPSITNPNYILNANLGWCDAENFDTEAREVKVKIIQSITNDERVFTIIQVGDHQESIGNQPYYQWGRKDPMPGNNGYSNAEKRKYGSVGFTYISGPVSLGETIQHPNGYYRVSGSSIGNWCTQRYDNLWNVDGINEADRVVVKTVYDPCPVGFTVPNRNAFSGATTTGQGVSNVALINQIGGWQNGWRIKASEDDTQGVYFPMTGVRAGTTGYLDERDHGYYGVATPCLIDESGQERYNIFGFRSTSLSVCSNVPRISASAIRPVAEAAANGTMGASTGGMDGHQYDFGSGGWQ